MKPIEFSTNLEEASAEELLDDDYLYDEDEDEDLDEDLDEEQVQEPVKIEDFSGSDSLKNQKIFSGLLQVREEELTPEQLRERARLARLKYYS